MKIKFYIYFGKCFKFNINIKCFIQIIFKWKKLQSKIILNYKIVYIDSK